MSLLFGACFLDSYFWHLLQVKLKWKKTTTLEVSLSRTEIIHMSKFIPERVGINSSTVGPRARIEPTPFAQTHAGSISAEGPIVVV